MRDIMNCRNRLKYVDKSKIKTSTYVKHTRSGIGWMHFLTFAVLAAIMVVFSAVMPASAQVTELWSRTYDGGQDDKATGVTTDANGNVIVTGYSQEYSSLDGNSYNYYTIKYNKDGNQLWSRSYDDDGRGDDYANGVATDADGNVIVTGAEYNKFAGTTLYSTIKYDSNGNKLWHRSWWSTWADWAKGVATDADGNVIVTGSTGPHPSLGKRDTIKYDKDGNVKWWKPFDGEFGYGTGVATDADGNVIVTGYPGGNYYTTKYDKDGNELWSRTYDGGFSDTANGVATDADGNIIVTGSKGAGWSDLTNIEDAYTIKYDKDGNELWNRTYNRQTFDIAHGVATDADGNVIVTGYTTDSSFIPDYFTIKYNKDGNELWSITYNGGSYDYAYGIATDADGNVIVTGWSYDGLDWNYHTIKYRETAPLDSDGDGLSDADEAAGWEVNTYGCDGTVSGTRHVTSDPNVADTDGDGLNDLQEKQGWHVSYTISTGPVAYDVKSDPRSADNDGDGLNDAQEKTAGTDPNRRNTDCDGAFDTHDGFEIANGMNPLNFDTDGDGVSDGLEIDKWFAAGFVLNDAIQKTKDPNSVPPAVSQPDLGAENYRWSAYHTPGYEFPSSTLFRSWNDVFLTNIGPGEAKNVKATIACKPVNVNIVDGAVDLGNIPAGGTAWSTDFYELETDLSNPQDPNKGIVWTVEYDDSSGVHHTVLNVPQFRGGMINCP